MAARGQRLRAFACSPTFKAVPVITGTAKVGQTLTLSHTLVNGNVTGRQWYRNGAAISGATAASYTAVSADIGATLSASVTATNSLRPSNIRTATSAPTATVVA